LLPFGGSIVKGMILLRSSRVFIHLLHPLPNRGVQVSVGSVL
jgi:hypothetical protein